MENKIFVLGATGNVGNPLVHLLKRHNADFCIGIKPGSVLPESMQGIESVSIDYNKPSTLETALAGIHTVFILIPDSPLMVDHATNIKNAVIKNNVFRYFYLGGLGSKLAPDTWLSQNLLKCEKIFSSMGITGTVIRPTFFMQNFLNHYPPDSDQQISLPLGAGKVSYIDANDVAFAAYKLLTDDQKVTVTEIDLTGNDPLTMDEIAILFSDVIEKRYRYRSISSGEAKLAMEKKELPDWLINMLLQIYGKVRDNRYAHSTRDFRLITGKEPESLKAFIKKNRSYFDQIALRKINH